MKKAQKEQKSVESDLWTKSHNLACEEKGKAFEATILVYKDKVSKVFQKLIDKTRYNNEICKISLTERLLQVVVKMPAYWSDTAVLSCRFDAMRDEKIDFDINYGAGGYNNGWSSLDAARQKADALLLVCDLAAELEKIDWSEFTGYYRTVTERQRQILTELQQA